MNPRSHPRSIPLSKEADGHNSQLRVKNSYLPVHNHNQHSLRSYIQIVLWSDARSPAGPEVISVALDWEVEKTTSLRTDYDTPSFQRQTSSLRVPRNSWDANGSNQRQFSLHPLALDRLPQLEIALSRFTGLTAEDSVKRRPTSRFDLWTRRRHQVPGPQWTTIISWIHRLCTIRAILPPFSTSLIPRCLTTKMVQDEMTPRTTTTIRFKTMPTQVPNRLTTGIVPLTGPPITALTTWTNWPSTTAALVANNARDSDA